MSGEKIIDGAEVGKRLLALSGSAKFLTFLHGKGLIEIADQSHAINYFCSINCVDASAIIDDYYQDENELFAIAKIETDKSEAILESKDE